MPLLGTLGLLLLQPRADKIDELIAAKMKSDHIPGVCLAIIPPGGTADVRSYGLANLETNTPFAPDTVHRVASLSKQFCSYVVLSLIKEGKLSPEDNLRKYFPKGPEAWSKVTLKMMLAHRSGIADPTTDFSYKDEYTPERYVEILSRKPLAEEPGSTYRYNNHGYALLGAIVGQVTNSTLREQVKKRIFEPLSMADARYFDAGEVIPHRADSYRWVDDKYVRPLDLRPRIFDGSGGILMSMNDMLAYERALRKEEVLDREILQRQRETYDGKDGYGAGWIMVRRAGKRVMAHNGGTFGFTSHYFRELEDGWTIIIFRNSEGGDIDAMGAEILKLAKAYRISEIISSVTESSTCNAFAAAW